MLYVNRYFYFYLSILFNLLGVIKVYTQLCEENGGKFPSFNCISGSDPQIMSLSCESKLKGSVNLDSAIEKVSSSKEPEHITKSIHYHDTLLYIYTSGTTGTFDT